MCCACSKHSPAALLVSTRTLLLPLLPALCPQLKAGKYKTMQQWRDDVQLIWDNAIKYNGEGHVVSNQALKLQQAVERRYDAAVEAAKQAMAAEARGEPRPRKSHKPRTTELQALIGGAPAASSDSDSLDEPTAAAAAAAGGRVSNGCDPCRA
jgi:bromodomain-containing factor 1